jgi:DNA-nicking Smr family endonuclease
MGRRRRGLSAEDTALWAEVARSAKPLRPAAASQQPPPAPPAPVPGPAADRPADPPPPATIRPNPRPSTHLHAAAEPVSALGPSTPGLDRRTAERLRRGRTEPQARIDLHGHTLDRAHGALIRFIRDGHGAGLRCVLVITGKGRQRQDEWGMPRQGVLRDSVPRWLTLPPLATLVVGIYPAHQKHGGGGAFYVYLRKAR